MAKKKAKIITGILIDPFARTVVPVTDDKDWDYRTIYRWIECEDRGFTCVYLEKDCLYLDDMGLYQGYEDYFTIGSYPHSMCGKGVLLGVDEEGETIDARMSVEILTGLIKWRKDRVIGMRTVTEDVMIYGSPGTRIRTIVDFESGRMEG